MPKKAFDILPPYPKKEAPRRSTHPKAKERKKSRNIFLLLFLFAFLVIVFFGFGKINFGTSPTSTPTTNQSSSNQFELFTDEGQSNLTSDNIITVRILDGSSTNNASQVKDLLLRAGFRIEKQEKSANPYEQTIIYYKKGGLTQAQQASDALKPAFSSQMQESDNLDKNIDLLIITGAK